MRTFKDTVSIHTQYLKTESVWRHNNPPPHQLYAGIISLSLPLSYLRIYGRFSPCYFYGIDLRGHFRKFKHVRSATVDDVILVFT